MDEREWLTETEPWRMLEHLRGQAGVNEVEHQRRNRPAAGSRLTHTQPAAGQTDSDVACTV